MRQLVTLLLFILTAADHTYADDANVPQPVPLWPLGVPGAVGESAADIPLLFVHRPPAESNVGAAVVICPGGGYGGLAIDKEGHEVGRWLNSFGVTGVVLKYRHAPRYGHPAPLQDVRRALQFVRASSVRFELSPDRIGVLGFSAGGHLAASASTLFVPGDEDSDDAISRVSSRPDFSILAYPVITLTDPHTHRGSRRNLLGEPAPADLVQQLSLELQVSKDTPPAFLFHTTTDRPVVVENSLLYYKALRKTGIDAELHVYRSGRHGVGLDRDETTRSWPALARDWMQHLGFLDPPAVPKWIWSGREIKDGTIYLRKVVPISKKARKATLAVAVDNSATVYVNGEEVLTSRTVNPPARADIAGKLRIGDNVIAAEVQNTGSKAGFLAHLAIESEDGGEQVIVTDSGWQAHTLAADGWRRSDFAAAGWATPWEIAPAGGEPFGRAVSVWGITSTVQPLAIRATAAQKLQTLPGFKVELLYSVPKEEHGSWVNLTPDPKGRLIVSDQYGGLYRVTPPAAGASTLPKIEKIDLDVGGAHGLLCAFDSLYVVGNENRRGGLYRVRDTDGDDVYDDVKLLRKIKGGGEHGPHAVLLSPDGRSLYIVGGNHTDIPDPEKSVVPRVWDEDVLLGRQWDATGHARGKLAPGGWIARTDPEGKEWELFANGFRNEFDAAFNAAGDLFTFDADMEWDVGTAWYRPTRVNHVVSGGEYGWRSGTAKWPTYYPDNLGSVVDIGPGSPTGIAFGYGTKFPSKYQQALFMCDWSYGKIFAVHLSEDGATWRGEVEQFVAGTPLPVSDVVANPHDGALYFTVGGRRAQSGLYRVTHEKPDPVQDFSKRVPASPARDLRRKLEAFHGRRDERAVAAAVAALAHPDRFVRYAARIALEHQPVATWQQRILEANEPRVLIEGAIALARHGGASLRPQLIEALERIHWRSLSEQQQLGLLRAYGLAFIRMGRPDAATASRLALRFNPLYPATSEPLNRELSQLLIYLEAPHVASKTVELMRNAPTQEEQIGYALALRNMKSGWTASARRAYFEWFSKAQGFFGGHSFNGFVRNIKKEAVENLTASEKESLADVLVEASSAEAFAQLPKPTGPGREWQIEQLSRIAEAGLRGRSFEAGEKMFSAAYCFQCHRFAGRGGSTGPDLTGVAGRFSVRDLIESIVEPSKTVSDQYEATTFVTLDGSVHTGRIVNMSGERYIVNTDMTKPDDLTTINSGDVLQMMPSPTSMMPAGLLNPLNQDEVLDLLAYLLSRGDRQAAQFR